MGVQLDRLQTLGGWAVQKNMREFYIEGSYVVPAAARHLF
jgi:hypothetical protein